jgi:hypothetical protein
LEQELQRNEAYQQEHQDIPKNPSPKIVEEDEE